MAVPVSPIAAMGESDDLGPTEFPLGLTFDDVLLIPRRSSIRSRGDVSTATPLTRRITLISPS